MASKLTFNKRRDEVRGITEAVIERALTADRQARDRARKVRAKQPDWDDLSAAEKEIEGKAAEDNIMTLRAARGIDHQHKMTEAVHIESVTLAKIDKEEQEEKLKNLPASSRNKEKEEMEKMNDDDKGRISKSFAKNLTPVIERWERRIIAAGQYLEPTLTPEELEKFTQRASNPDDVRAYLEKWGAEDADIDEGLDEEEKEEAGNDIEVVVSEDEDEDEDEDEEMADFIVEDEDEDEDDEDEE